MFELRSIQVGLPRTYGVEGATNPLERPWHSGIDKTPVTGPIWLGSTNLTGDGQADLHHHGGPHKAVCVYAAEHYPFWQRVLQRTDFGAGAFGENFTIAGATEADVCIGDTYRIGSAVMQVSQPRQPCWKLARRWGIKDLAAQVQQTGYTGWYLRVLAEGLVAAGMTATLLERPYPQWTIERANEIMHRRRHDTAATAALAGCPLLSPNWRDTLQKRVATGAAGDERARLIGTNT